MKYYRLSSNLRLNVCVKSGPRELTRSPPVSKINVPMNSALRLSVQVHCPKNSPTACFKGTDLDSAVIINRQKRVS